MMRARRHVSRRFTETGQAILLLVLGLTLIITTGAALMVESTIQHDPLVQTDTVEHFSYRALEAGMNTFLSEANKNPNELTCSSKSPRGGQCTPTDFMKWKRIAGTNGTGVVPEYYAWGNPTFCFSETCTSSQTKNPVLYVKVTVYGAAGFTTVHMSFMKSTLNVEPVNGFLTRIWWSTYEATDPHLKGDPTSDCTYDWKNGYKGPNTTGVTACSEVVFASGTQVHGSLYANDSFYIDGSPTLGQVETADPKCLFVSVTVGCITKATQEKKHTVHQKTATLNSSESDEPIHPLPTTDSTLERWAAYDGCVYTGPTTIRFDSTGKMTVWSKGTPQRTATATTPKCPSTHTQTGKVATNTAPVPNGTRGDGVIYVNTAPAPCTKGVNAGASPFDDYSTGKNGTKAQYAVTTSTGKTYYAWWGAQPHPDCEGDAFVSDNPSGGGVKGQLTIGTSNDVIITGTIKYLNCGTSFESTVTHPCNFNTTAKSTDPNDSLGLIAQNYVMVNHPLKPTTCTKVDKVTVCKIPKPTSSATLAPTCTSSVLGTPAAALCNPITDSTKSTLTIDAALLALNHSFAVDNEALVTGGGGVGPLDGTLKIYGTIDQKWRGAIGIVGTSGYTKNYDWNSVGAVITPPHYLDPSTASWAIASSPIYPERIAPAFGAPTATT